MDDINIKLNVKITTHDAVNEDPFVAVSVNGYPKFGEFCSEDTLIDFNVSLSDDELHTLNIEYRNKDSVNDVVLNNNGDIINDKRVEITSIQFEEIKLDVFQLDHETLFYTTSDSQGINSTSAFEACKLSWNGITTLKFSTPIYIWLLENL